MAKLLFCHSLSSQFLELTALGKRTDWLFGNHTYMLSQLSISKVSIGQNSDVQKLVAGRKSLILQPDIEELI